MKGNAKVGIGVTDGHKRFLYFDLNVQFLPDFSPQAIL